MTAPLAAGTRAALVHILTRADARDKSRRASGLAIYFHALGCAEEHPQGIVAGILDNFTHSRMRDAMLKACGCEPCQCRRAGQCERCR